jgi:hypothetical protein
MPPPANAGGGDVVEGMIRAGQRRSAAGEGLPAPHRDIDVARAAMRSQRNKCLIGSDVRGTDYLRPLRAVGGNAAVEGRPVLE